MRCPAGEEPAVNELLYFGTAKPDGRVSEGEWLAFLRAEVTPRFPQGFTVWAASGQWKGADGTIVREGSFLLNLVHPAGQSAETAIRELVADYKTRFAQEAVLRVRSFACISF